METRREKFGQEPGSWEIERPSPGVGVVALVGEHDMSTAADIEVALATLAHEERHLVVDVCSATFLDSSIVNALYRVLARQRAAGRRLVLQAGTETVVLQALRITGLLDEVPMAGERGAALSLAQNG